MPEQQPCEICPRCVSPQPLHHTLVTEKAYEDLKKTLPDCRIIFDRDSALPNRRHS